MSMSFEMKDYEIKDWNSISIGDEESFTKTMTQEDVNAWLKITEDYNPVHFDEEYAATTRFKDIIVPGIMVAGLISNVMTRATFGNVYSGQTLKFLKPVYIGDTITAKATVTGKIEEKHRVVIKTECFNQDGDLVITGEGQEYIMP